MPPKLRGSGGGPRGLQNCSLRGRLRWQKLHTSRVAFDDGLIAAFGIGLAGDGAMSGPKRFVYVVTTATQPQAFYVGVTNDVPLRLADHNAGRCVHTLKHRPWQLHVAIEFTDEATALRFERYLKSGSGRAFAKRHLSVSGEAEPAPSRTRSRAWLSSH